MPSLADSFVIPPSYVTVVRLKGVLNMKKKLRPGFHRRKPGLFALSGVIAARSGGPLLVRPPAMAREVGPKSRLN